MGNSGRVPRQLTTVIYYMRQVRGPENGSTASHRAVAERREA